MAGLFDDLLADGPKQRSAGLFDDLLGDTPAPDTEADPDVDQQVITSARGWRGAGAGRGTPFDPRRLDTRKSDTVLEGTYGMPAPQFDPVEAEKLSNRRYAQDTDPNAPIQRAPSATEFKGRMGPSDMEMLGAGASDSGIIGRGMAKALTGAVKGLGGVTRSVGEFTGIAPVTAFGRSAAAGAGQIDKGIGDAQPLADFAPGSVTNYIRDMGEGAISSLAQSVALGAGLGPGGALAMMGVLSAGDKYDEARNAGLEPGMALANAIPTGAFEVLGEKFTGTDKMLKGIGTLLTKGASDSAKREAASAIVQAGVREVPGEVFTYLGQTGVDLLPGVGINPNLTMKDFLDGLRDTVVQSAMMGGGVGAAGVVARRNIQPEQQSAMDLAKSKGFLTPEPQRPAAVVNFTDPSGPVGQSGITPVVVPLGGNQQAPNVSTPSVSGPVAPQPDAAGSDLAGAGVDSAGLGAGVRDGAVNIPAPTDTAGATAAPVQDAAAQPSAVVAEANSSVSSPGTAGTAGTANNPVARTSDADLLSRIPTEQVEPETVMMRRGGGGYETQESAATAMETGRQRQPDLDWKVEPIDNGRFRVAGYTRQASNEAVEPAQTAAASTATAQPALAPLPRSNWRQNQTGTVTVYGNPDEVKARFPQATGIAFPNRVVFGVSSAPSVVAQLEGRNEPAPMRDANAVGDATAGARRNEGQAVAGGVPGVADTAGRAVSAPVAPAVRDAAAARASAQVAVDRAHAANPKRYPKVTLGEPDAEASEQLGRAAQETAQAFGVSADVVFFSDPDPKSANGFEVGGRVYINTRGLANSALRTGWHETHHILQGRAEADDRQGLSGTASQRYRDQVDALFDGMSDEGKRNYVANFLHADELAGLDDKAKAEKVEQLIKEPNTRREMVADFVGNRADDRKFIKSLAKADPKGFEDFAKRWLKLIDDLIRQLRGNRANKESAAVDKYVADLNKARMVLRDAMVELRNSGADATPVASDKVSLSRRQTPRVGISLRELRESFSRNPDDYNYGAGDIDNSAGNNLGNFDLDFTNEPDVVAAAPAPATSRRNVATIPTAAAQAGPVDPNQVTAKDMLKHGIFAERAFDFGTPTDSADGTKILLNLPSGFPYVPDSTITLNSSTGKASVPWYLSTWLEPVDRSIAINFARHQTIKGMIKQSGYDLADAYRKGTIQRLATTWREIAKKSGAFRLGTSNSKEFLAVARDLGAFKKYDVTKSGTPQSGGTIVWTEKVGRNGMRPMSFDATINNYSDYIDCCTVNLKGSGDIGSDFYAVASMWAMNIGKPFHSDNTLSGINTYRRTEQALSFALKTGRTDVILPGKQNRVYGYKEDASTEEDHNRNIARLALANMRNVAEVFPYVRSLRYNAGMDMFTDRNGRDAEKKVSDFLDRAKNPDAGVLGFGRSTIARAVVTGQILQGDMTGLEGDYFDKPIAYSRKQAGLDSPLSESWGEEGDVNPKLKEFLGESVMQHPDGTPIVMYHGTAQDIRQFRAKQAGAIFLTENPDFAEDFAHSSKDWMVQHYIDALPPDQIAKAKKQAIAKIMADKRTPASHRSLMKYQIENDKAVGESQDYLHEELKEMMPTGPNIMPLFVRAENPFHYDNKSHVDDVVFTVLDQQGGGEMAEINLVSGKTKGVFIPEGDLRKRLAMGEWQLIESPQVQAALKSLGHDGFFVIENGQQNLAVYEPTQIKSAIGNNGNYDREDPRISFSKKQTPEQHKAALVKKFERMRRFHVDFPQLLQRIDQDAPVREEAAILRLIARTGFRIGGEPMKGKEAYGASTLKPQHVRVNGDVVYFDFIGKAQVPQRHNIVDPVIAKDLAARIASRGDRLFSKADRAVRKYLDSIIAGKDYKVHDFRTYVATSEALEVMKDIPPPENRAEYRAGVEIVGSVAAVKIGDQLGVTLEHYVDPQIFEEWRKSAGVEDSAGVQEGAGEGQDQFAETTDAGAGSRDDGGVLREEGEVAFSRKQQRAPGLPGESNFMAVRRTLQDQFIQVKVLQDTLTARGGTVGEAQDVYRAEERMHGRATALLTDFANQQLKPFIEKVTRYKLDIDEVALYAYAMHAKERNNYIKSINPKIGDAGSGMSDDEADNIIQLAQLSGDKAAFDELHQDLMGITSTTRRVLLDEGLITQEEYDGWSNLYQNYVPLRGFENVDAETGKARPGVGRGFSITGKESVKALGRNSKAGQILENIIRDYERAVARSERNAVAKTFLDLATSNPDPALWEVQPVKYSRSFNKASGMVLMRKAEDTGEDTIAIKVAGQSVRVKINDPLILRAMKLAAKDETSQLERLIADTLGTYTDLMRNTLTRYNPIFGAINAVRDGQMGAVAVYDELGAPGLKLYMKHLPAALAASWRSERDKAGNGPMDRYMQEMRFAGGSTGGFHTRNLDEITDTMQEMLLTAGAAPKTKMEWIKSKAPYRMAKWTLKWLEIVGATSEDAARVAGYRAAREMGKTPGEAAKVSKNLTTNFNRKGEWGQTLNSLFLFYNAGVQGSTRVIEALGNPKVRYMMAGATAAAMSIALLNAGMGDDDDEQAYWDKIPDYEKERNLIFMLPPGAKMAGANEVGNGGRYIKIPMPYGLNVFAVLGNSLADMARYAKDPSRGKKPAKAAINLVSAVFGSFNPFGGGLDVTKPIELAMAVSPTALDLPIQLATGTNAFGRPVGPEKSPFDERPDSENFSARQAGTASQYVARWLNSVTGGNEARSGAIDLMPGTLDNLVRNTTGGLGVFFADTFVNLPVKLYSPVETTTRDVPLWRNFYGGVDDVTDMGLFYDRRAEVSKIFKEAQKEMELGIEVKYDDESVAKQSLGKAAEFYTRKMTKLRKEEIAIAADEEMTWGEKKIARREIEKERAQFAQAFNTEYVSDTRAALRAEREKMLQKLNFGSQ